MGRILLVVRLALRDLRRRRTEAALLLLAIMAATTTLTLGLVLRDAASDPYQSTRAATKGPDVVASVGHARRAVPTSRSWPPRSGVIEHSGPYPVIAGKLEASGRTSDVQVVGRDAALASVDQPEVTQGSWVSDGGVVVEAAFANALDVSVGDSVTLDGTVVQGRRRCGHRRHAALSRRRPASSPSVASTALSRRTETCPRGCCTTPGWSGSPRRTCGASPRAQDSLPT